MGDGGNVHIIYIDPIEGILGVGDQAEPDVDRGLSIICRDIIANFDEVTTRGTRISDPWTVDIGPGNSIDGGLDIEKVPICLRFHAQVVGEPAHPFS